MLEILMLIALLIGLLSSFLLGYSTKCHWRDALIEWVDRELERQRMFFCEQLEKTLEMYDGFYQNYKKAVDEQRVKDRAVFEKSLAEISEMYDEQCRRCFSCHKNQREDERNAEK